MKTNNRVLILASIYLIFSFATMAYFFYTAFSLVEEKQEEILRLELENTRSQIRENFVMIETVLANVESYVLENPDNDDFLNFIVNVDKNNDYIASLYLGKVDKTFTNSSNFDPDSDFDFTTRIWYQRAIESDDTIITPAFINYSHERVILTVAKAIYIDDDLLGVVAADIDIKTIVGFISEKKIGKTGFAFLIDENSNILAYPEMETEVIDLQPVSDFDSNLSLLSGSGSNNNYVVQGTKGVLYYQTLDPFEILLGVFLPSQEFSSGFIIISNVFLSLTIAMGILAFVLIITYNIRIKNPLESLLSDIERIDILDSSKYILPEHEKDDYLKIRQSINKVLKATDLYFNEKHKAQAELMIENQRVKLLMESTADIIFEIDTSGNYVSVFGKGLDLMEMGPHDYIGKSVLTIYGENKNERLEAYKKALSGKHCVYDWKFIRKDGVVLSFESSISPIYGGDKRIIGAVGISRDITEAMQKQKEIEYISIHDFLTGLYNRRYFVDSFIEKDKIENYPLGIVMIDLNGLKILNDAYGHYYGDLGLKKVAEVLQEVTGEDDTVFRIGGDEFAVITVRTSNSILDKLKDQIRTGLVNINIKNIQLSVAIGYEIKDSESTSFEEMMKNAENHMYRNKLTEGRSVRNNSIKAILKTLTDKFEEEKTHSTRVSELCKKMGEALSFKTDDLKELEIAGLFHDIGKISIPDTILHKPGKLTDKEYEIIKTHTENGYNILRAADEYSNLAEYALSHHEHYNGKGYPRGLKGNEIPLFSRIICVCDAYEAMTSDRIYRKKLNQEEAIDEIVKYSGTQFDPELAQVFVEKVLKKEFK